jgi:threonine dehydratase
MPIPAPEIHAALARIRPHLAPTPLVRSGEFSRRLEADVYFKLDVLQPTHSFKVRGAFSALTRLDEAQRKRGVVTASGGNHGLAVAHAASALGIPASIFLPTSATQAKLSAIRRLGPEVVIHGAAWDDANVLAQRQAAEGGRTYVHPFDNADVMAGQATVMTEILDELRPDLVVASIGGGGLISGILSAAAHFAPEVRVVGVETVGADSMYRSREAGRIVELPAITSIAETLGARKTEKFQFETVMRHVSDLVTVPDEAAIRALLEILGTEKILTEPAASCSLAALLEGRVRYAHGERIVVVLCGGNIGLDQVRAWLDAR